MKKLLLITSIFVSLILIDKSVFAQYEIAKSPFVLGEPSLQGNFNINNSKTPGDAYYAQNIIYTDINSQVQNLYSILEQGKSVALDISAVW